ncbi:hypothetical protein IPM19_00065 [bacterium]|nr:MAG: hypothetical protein IPM19_00065 [bacterium]
MFESDNSRPPKIRVSQTDHRPTRDKLGNLMEEVVRNRNKPSNRKMWIIIAISVAVVAVIGFFLIRAQMQLKELQNGADTGSQNDPAAQLQEDNKKLIEQVRKLIILPDDEEPTIATVNDLSKLQGQPFFAKAQLGDKVLIYNKARKAILFRPSDNQIIELAPLVDPSASSPADGSAGQTPASGQ